MGGRKTKLVGSEPEPKKKAGRKIQAVKGVVEPADVEVITPTLQQDEVRVKTKKPELRRAQPSQKTSEVKRSQTSEVKERVRPRPVHGKRYRAAEEKYDRSLSYDLPQAISLVRELSYSKFYGTVELHARLMKPKKVGEEGAGFRTMLNLPYGTGRMKKVAIASDELIEEIAAGKLNFDVLIASPAMMPKLAKVAKILGPKGLMPSPKSGTISEKPEELVGEFEKGRLEVRADKDWNVHLPVGKVSQSAEDLTENVVTALKVLPKGKIQSVTLAASMSPPVRLRLDTISILR